MAAYNWKRFYDAVPKSFADDWFRDLEEVEEGEEVRSHLKE